jgi:hypothetical protein
MKRRLVLFVLLLCGVLSVPLSPLRVTQIATVEAAAERKACIVFVTRTGERYHVDGCRYLRRSRIPMEKREAIRAGFTPCRVCGGSDC